MDPEDTDVAKMLGFFEKEKTKLIQIYITERHKINELGALFLFFTEDNVKTVFYSISDKLITDEVRNDMIEKNNHRNTYSFFYLCDQINNKTILRIEDLDTKK